MDVSFSLDEPEPGAASVAGVNPAVKLDGSVPAENVTEELKPPLTETFKLTDTPPPGANETENEPELS
ncbi:MAG TPA: hypothetical protein VEV37_06990 [Bryobacteraceae bacterium]|nr:hypothetical protein [Bryobacteraceae bacterium]